jgi:hypothetical protein
MESHFRSSSVEIWASLNKKAGQRPPDASRQLLHISATESRLVTPSVPRVSERNPLRAGRGLWSTRNRRTRLRLTTKSTTDRVETYGCLTDIIVRAVKRSSRIMHGDSNFSVKSAYAVHTHPVQHLSQKQPLGNQTSMSTYPSLFMRVVAASIKKPTSLHFRLFHRSVLPFSIASVVVGRSGNVMYGWSLL